MQLPVREDAGRITGADHRQHDRLLLDRELQQAPLELLHERRHHRALLRLLAHRLLQQIGQTRRHIGAPVADRRRLLVDVPHRHGHEILARKRKLSRQELVQHDRERVDIRALLDRSPLRLLGRDVVGAAEHRSGECQAGPDLGGRARDAEVDHLRHPSAVEQHVLRLHVAMHEPATVSVLEPTGDLDAQLEDRLQRKRSAFLDQPLQAPALDVFEDDVGAALVFTAVDHDRDVRMRELGDRARLPAEALDVLRVGRVLLVEHLDGDFAAEDPVACPVDAGHAALADELLELVPLLQDVPDHQTGRVGPPAAGRAGFRGI